ncbi:MAG: nuclear transport factor 2 family protein [Gammaproteobacteria bacterium]|nr:nuclear transport factor 2 family protein [Gammaproteobacteria bacterium]
MSNNFEKTWETYTSSWKVESSDDKRAIFETCLDSKCEYNDPLAKVIGWNELAAYMLDFHKQIPGGYFVTNYFLAHNNQSIAKWLMRNGENTVLGEGISYGKYNEKGKLISMTGFFETPGK